MDWLGSDHVENPTDTQATTEDLFSVRGPCRGVIRRQLKFTAGVGARRRRSDFREFAVEGDKEEIKLCQGDLACGLKTLQVL
jgi:hypothetical protein